MGKTMKPITAKDHDLPKLRRANKIVSLRPRLDIRTDDYEALLRQMKRMNLSMSGGIKMQILRSLGNDENNTRPLLGRVPIFRCSDRQSIMVLFRADTMR